MYFRCCNLQRIFQFKYALIGKRSDQKNDKILLKMRYSISPTHTPCCVHKCALDWLVWWVKWFRFFLFSFAAPLYLPSPMCGSTISRRERILNFSCWKVCFPQDHCWRIFHFDPRALVGKFRWCFWTLPCLVIINHVDIWSSLFFTQPPLRRPLVSWEFEIAGDSHCT